MRSHHEGAIVEAMPGMASDDELELLERGADPDALFVALMLDHHAAERAGLDASPFGVTFDAYDPDTGRFGGHTGH